MLNTLSKIAVVLNSLVVVLYVWGPIFYGQTLTSRDIAILAINLLSAALNAAALAMNKEA